LIADSLIETSATALHYTQQIVNPVTSGASYLLSVYAKANTRSSIELLDPYALVGRTFNLSNGTTSASQTGAGAPSSFAIQPVGDGWYRCSIGVTASGTSIALRITVSNGSATVYTGDGTSGIFLWGAQLEAGAFPTSYIPTTSATVTRAADVASITGSAFSGWYNQTEGTFYSENRIGGFQVNKYPNVFNVNDSTNNNVINNYRLDYAIRYTYGVNAGGVAQTSFSQSATIAAGAVAKMATIRRLTYWPRRLPNAMLQAITS
jgi:hypothetical protein